MRYWLCATAAFFRTLGVATSDYNVAARLASVLISFMVTYTGYMVSVSLLIRQCLRWFPATDPRATNEEMAVLDFL